MKKIIVEIVEDDDLTAVQRVAILGFIMDALLNEAEVQDIYWERIAKVATRSIDTMDIARGAK